jgi:tetratricopeptide (TPR) repeat protein
MDNQQKLRIKTAMIVYALEEALGNYVIQNEELIDDISEGTRTSIVDREKERGNNINKDSITQLVEASYLNEIFSFALDLTENTDFNNYLNELKSLASILGIFDIRNAVSHPNRAFPDCYWYRAAVIASDPLIEKLKLTAVKQALSSAEAENLNPPPDEWLNNVHWAIPNTLPTSFDHEITGLLGREKEFKDLKGVLSKIRNNLIAVVAPGGVGKTSLILQFLKDISLSPEWNGKINAISFCTLKNERLTADGIEYIEAINGIDQIKDSILKDLGNIYSDKSFESFDEACEQLEDEKILICIDNLETLLMNSQKEFINFNQSLPIQWRVVVTSRVSVDSATTVPLEPLIKRHAVNLCRNYFRKRGVSNFTQDDLEKIADMANNNPLAIRLTIDLYLKGVDISKSIEKSQKDIALFSYKNLIESLKDNSISVLEAIYAIGDSTKSELIELLDLSGEEIVESINELSKTSLIIRAITEIGDDSFRLSDSIRDLLLITPKNIEIRTKIADSIKQRKAKILEQTKRDQQLGITKFDEQFIEKNTDPSTHVLIVDLNKFLSVKNRQRQNLEILVDIKNRFVDLLNHMPHSYQLHYHNSRVLRFLKDKQGEYSSLQKALKHSNENPRVLLSISLFHFYNDEYDKSETDFKKLIDCELNRPSNSTQKYSYTINNCYLHSLLKLGKYDEILDFTKDWESDSDWLVLFGTHRATSFKRKIELRTASDIAESEKSINEAVYIFSKIFEKEGYQNVACTEALKLIKQVQTALNSSCQYSDSFVMNILNFISVHFFNLAGSIRTLSIDSNEVQDIIKTFYDIEIKDNPLKEANWYKPRTRLVYDREHIAELENEGFTIVEVCYIPEGDYMPNYLFAKDKNEEQFYLKVDYFDGGWNRWGYIDINTKLAIIYQEKSQKHKYRRASLIVEIDQFDI